MSQRSNNGRTLTPGIYTAYAKFQNLYSTVDEMYKSGSKQSHMALNLQFIISQIMTLLKESSRGSFLIHNDVKRQIERHSKAFYHNYGDKEFFHIENQIGFIYCLLTLISKGMILPTTGYDILAALSLIDSQSMLKHRDDTLDSLKSGTNPRIVEDTSISLSLFAPDKRTVSNFDDMVENTPRVLKPISIKSRKSTNVLKGNAKNVVKNVFHDMERIVLKPTPFDGDFHDYFQTVTGSSATNTSGKRHVDQPETRNSSNQLPIVVKEGDDTKSVSIGVNNERNDPQTIVDAKKGRLEEVTEETKITKLTETETTDDRAKDNSEEPVTKSDQPDEDLTK